MSLTGRKSRKAEKETSMYGIKANYNYYTGTINAPESGYLTDDYTGERLLFDTKEAALNYLGFTEENACKVAKFTAKGKIFENHYQKNYETYYLSHGEYSQSTYQIKKVK